MRTSSGANRCCQRLDELIDVAVVMIDDAQTYFEQADACDLSNIPKSILEE